MVSWCLRPVRRRGRGPAPGFTPACSARPPAAIICTTTGEPWRGMACLKKQTWGYHGIVVINGIILYNGMSISTIFHDHYLDIGEWYNGIMEVYTSGLLYGRFILVRSQPLPGPNPPVHPLRSTNHLEDCHPEASMGLD